MYNWFHIFEIAGAADLVPSLLIRDYRLERRNGVRFTDDGFDLSLGFWRVASALTAHLDTSLPSYRMELEGLSLFAVPGLLVFICAEVNVLAAMHGTSAQ